MFSVAMGEICSLEDEASSGGCWDVNIGPVAAVGDREYAGGGAFEATVKAFIPGRSGRRVAVDVLVRGLGFLRGVSMLKGEGLKSTGPLNAGTVNT